MSKTQKFIDPTVVDALLHCIGGGFFSITFVKKDGTERKMKCRRGVKKHLKGGESTIKEIPNLVGVYEISNDYRCFDKRRVLKIKGAGCTVATNG